MLEIPKYVNRWEILSGPIVMGKSREKKVRAKCSCGTERYLRVTKIKYGDISISCGCFRKERTKEIKTTHGEATRGSRSKEYSVWAGMISRCYYEKSASYPRYGLVGISVCDEWRESFEKFLEDMGRCPPGMQLDRVNNSSGYSKENCRWVTARENALNRKSTVWITLDGETEPLKYWLEKFSVQDGTYRQRKKKGWDIEKIFKTPINRKVL